LGHAHPDVGKEPPSFPLHNSKRVGAGKCDRDFEIIFLAQARNIDKTTISSKKNIFSARSIFSLKQINFKVANGGLTERC
ncbi:hypothetical protein, partial [Lacticaseibacillus yichunensis]|uniref:hypothetical protein n=1 Tax=Lacticaseibacillus yichunensis TaxID=2486015 RepID=UPI001CDD7083